jgi:hypothetical protein
MSDIAIRVTEDAAGALVHLVSIPPEAVPPVHAAALLTAWEAARAAATAGRWGPPRRFMFEREHGSATVLELADRDARCWAAAVDRLADLGTPRGLALCLRLLALIDAMAAMPWLADMFEVTAQDVDLHPALLRAAATLPLDAGARFDAAALRGLLSPRSSATPQKARYMPRLAPLLLPLLLLACTTPNLGFPRIDAPMGGAPRDERDGRFEACRAEATRVVQFRDRGQIMRTDETENSRGTIVVAPPGRPEADRAGQQLTRDQMIQDCIRAAPTPGGR